MTEVAKFSREVTYSIKHDKFIQVGDKVKRAIAYLTEQIAVRLDEYPFLKNLFGPNVVLVPAPRSSPLTRGALWPSHRICQGLVANGLGERVDAVLERYRPVRRASTAARGERPGPLEHYMSVRLRPQVALGFATAVTLVDDVVTRGATFVGFFPHLRAAFPGIPIHCFALVRTMSYAEIQQIRDPVEGVVDFQYGSLRREPGGEVVCSPKGVIVARDQAAKLTGVSGRTVDNARTVRRHGTPELVKAVEDGKVAVSSAGGLYALRDIYRAADGNAA
jgi:hypothetical protein